MAPKNQTPFYDKCRELRLERRLLMADQAKEFKCSPAYISHIETGKRPIPDGYVDKLAKWHHLDEAETKELHRLANAQRKLVKIVPADEERAALASDLSRVINAMPDEKISEMRKLISESARAYSNKDVVDLATALQSFFKPSDDALKVLEHIVVRAAPHLRLEVEEDKKFARGMRGECDSTDPSAVRITLSESTYLGAAEQLPDGRYWLMHEFAHFLLHKKHLHGGHFDSSFRREEEQAHLFARTVLLPTELAKRIAEKPNDLTQVARFCRVPGWVILQRLDDLRLRHSLRIPQREPRH